MRVLILGGSGMLGHKLAQFFSKRFETFVTVRQDPENSPWRHIFAGVQIKQGIDFLQFDNVIRVVAEVRPQVIVNCIGVIKQVKEASDPIASLTANSLLPHRLANLCRATQTRLIHISTDCVFSGRRGNYSEADLPDAEDLYGRSKMLGEITSDSGLTIRTSIIGRELGTRNGLVEWFLAQGSGSIRGYTNAIYTGFPTITAAGWLADVIDQYPEISGVYHVSSDPISKYDLLCLLRAAYQVPIDINAFADFQCNRALDSSRFRAVTGFAPPPWPEMVRKMAEDSASYEEWSDRHGS